MQVSGWVSALGLFGLVVRLVVKGCDMDGPVELACMDVVGYDF